jgi:hypothetical protein
LCHGANPAHLWARFEDHVERRLCGAPEAAEAAGGYDFAQFRLSAWMRRADSRL